MLSDAQSTNRQLGIVPVNSNPRAMNAQDRAWVTNALCRNSNPDDLFVGGKAQRKAATICRNCPVKRECGADALDNRVEYGVWGGLTERRRRALLKQHPEVMSWAEFFTKQNARFAG